MAGLRLDGLFTTLPREVDLTLAAGERVFLSGASGSGKSRLLRAVADLDPHRGEVWLDGLPRSRLTPPEWRRRVGLLPAESHWWAETVGEHWRAPAAGSPIEPLLAALGFDADVSGWAITRLSTGERQRLALARLLLNQPQWSTRERKSPQPPLSQSGAPRQRQGDSARWSGFPPLKEGCI